MPVTFDVAKELVTGSTLFVYRAGVFVYHVVQRRRVPRPVARKCPMWYC